ncbi:MAG TPA: LacI family DNA-binding transcriptional regulator [Lacunisphaera sp.]|nr:LacI family DNA-binding transcriptional regulator [Lacunisphaera sp.]
MAAVVTPSSPPTLREIARRAGVSHTTVSLSLRNHPSIPAPTRERLRRLADRLGYRSNVLVSALMSQVRLKHAKAAPEVVGFLTGGASADDWKNHSYSVGCYEGARQRAQQLGMRVEPFWLGLGGRAAAATCRMLHARAIHGNLIVPFPVPVYDHELDWAHMICVGLGYVYNHRALHRATHNHFRGAFLAYQKLAALGYRRIGLMLDRDENSRVNYLWLGGYLAAQRTMTGPALDPLLTTGPVDRAQVRAWLRRARPEVVIGFGPRQFLALAELGCRIPGDIAYVALDVEQTHLAHVEAVTGINQNLPLIGATAIDILASQLYHNEKGLPQRPVFSMIEGYWVPGETAPALRPAPDKAGTAPASRRPPRRAPRPRRTGPSPA